MGDCNNGTQFDFSYAPGTSAEQIFGFEMAGEIWSSMLADDVTVRIYVESTSELPGEVIGAALPGKKSQEEYEDVIDALRNDITSADDELAFSNLPDDDDDEFSILVNGRELDETEEFRLTNANAKSLDLSNNHSDRLDGYILVNDLLSSSSVGWDYDALPSGSSSENEIDFLSVAMHEIGHVLGFVSGIDDGDWLNVLTRSAEEDEEIDDEDFKFASPLDLYRYSDSSSEPGEIDLSVGGNPYFSIDGGNTSLGSFANGEYTQFGGDGYQASHWRQFSNQGVMNPILPQGQRRDVSDLDLTAFDVIGWDINTAAAPSWNEMYDNAVANASTANIQNRDDDVEQLVQDSGYEARRERNKNPRRYNFQLGGFWQFTTVEPVDTPEAIDVAELAVEDLRIVDESEALAQSDDLVTAETEIVNNNGTVSNDNTTVDTDIVLEEAVYETEEDFTVDENNENSSQIETEAIANEVEAESETELISDLAENNLEQSDSDDDNDDWYDLDYGYIASQFVTGIADGEEDSLFDLAS